MVHGGVSKGFFECRRRKDRGMLASMIDRLENAIYHWIKFRLEQHGERAQTPAQQRVDLVQESDMPLDSRGGEKLLPENIFHQRSDDAAAWASAAHCVGAITQTTSTVPAVDGLLTVPEPARQGGKSFPIGDLARMRRRRTKTEAARRHCPEARLPCSSCAHSAVTELTRRLD